MRVANFADCTLVSDDTGHHCIVAVTSARSDGEVGSYYTLHSPEGGLVGYGHSKGWQGTGSGSALSAMKNGRAAAKRWLARELRNRAKSAPGATPAR